MLREEIFKAYLERGSCSKSAVEMGDGARYLKYFLGTLGVIEEIKSPCRGRSLADRLQSGSPIKGRIPAPLNRPRSRPEKGRGGRGHLVDVHSHKQILYRAPVHPYV